MSKELEALKRIKNKLTQYGQIEYEVFLDYQDKIDLDLIKKALKALEIIKDHKLLNYVLKNEKCANMYHLSKEEKESLKELLSNYED